MTIMKTILQKSCALTLLSASLILASCVTTERSTSTPTKTSSSYSTSKDGSASAAAAGRTSTDASSSKTATEASMPRKATPAAPSFLAFPTGDVETSALLLEKRMPSEVVAGAPFDYEIQVTNLTSMSLDNVVVSETLPNNFTVASTSPKLTSSTGGVGQWALGSLRPEEAKIIRVRGTAKDAGVVQACASVSYDTGLCTALAVVKPALKLQAFGPSDASACDPLEYRYVVTNSGTGTARDVVVESKLPTGLTTSAGAPSFSKKIGDLASGKSREFTVPMKVSRTGEFTHGATASAGAGLRAESSKLSTTVTKPVLEIAMTGPKKHFFRRNFKYEITVTNKGDAVAEDVVVTDRVPEGAKFVSASDGGRASKGTVSWKLGTLRPKATRKVQVTLAAERMGLLSSKATAKAECADAVDASVQTTIEGIPAVLLEVVDLEDPIEVGQNVTYVVTATNQGSAEARNLEIACSLPDISALVSHSGSSAAAVGGQPGARNVTFARISRLAPGAKASWRIVIQAKESGDARFKVAMTTSRLTDPVEETEATHFYQ